MRPRVIERIYKLQNRSRNLGWGTAEYKPLMKTMSKDVVSQWVIVVGHNYHKTMRTMFLEETERGLVLYEEVDNRLDGAVLCSGDEDDVMHKIVERLKVWFPEVRA